MNNRSSLYTLGYPNPEARKGFLRNLLGVYNGLIGNRNSVLVEDLVEAMRKGHPETLMRQVDALIAGIPYSRKETRNEFWLRDMVYLVFSLLGFRVEVERHISSGRIDCVVETEEYVYVIEFKYGGSVEEALRQIEEKGYARPYCTGRRKVYKIGANYDPKTCSLQYVID